MNKLAETVLDSVDWTALHTLGPLGDGLGSAERVPQAMMALAAATTESATWAAYDQLDNVVLVQQALFDSAPPAVSVLLAILQGPISPHAKRACVELLLQIGLGESDWGEVDRGRPDLGEQGRAHLRRAVWTIYGLLLDPDPLIRSAAISLLLKIENDKDCLRMMLRKWADTDSDAKIRTLASRALDDLGN